MKSATEFAKLLCRIHPDQLIGVSPAELAETPSPRLNDAELATLDSALANNDWRAATELQAWLIGVAQWNHAERLGRWTATAALREPDAAVCGPSTTSGDYSKMALALATLADHPDWTVEQIAEKVGASAKYLSSEKRFTAARQAIKGDGKNSHRRGRSRGADVDEYGD